MNTFSFIANNETDAYNYINIIDQHLKCSNDHFCNVTNVTPKYQGTENTVVELTSTLKLPQLTKLIEENVQFTTVFNSLRCAPASLNQSILSLN
jgi:hypothetical protein